MDLVSDKLTNKFINSGRSYVDPWFSEYITMSSVNSGSFTFSFATDTPFLSLVLLYWLEPLRNGDRDLSLLPDLKEKLSVV